MIKIIKHSVEFKILYDGTLLSSYQTALLQKPVRSRDAFTITHTGFSISGKPRTNYYNRIFMFCG